jgi:3-oxoacyl-[acyl-carrier protein] reductase
MSNSANKVALITGAATGIGRAVAVDLASSGYAIAVNYSRSETEANATLAKVRETGVPAILCRCNIADDGGVREMVQMCVDELGGLDVLVNNAATTRFIAHTDLEALTDEVWNEILNVNLKGTFSCCRAALPHLRRRKGCIVNVTSVAGLQGYGSSIPYAASKAAVNCMTQSLARAFAPDVRVNAVAPGPVLTRWVADHMDMIDQAVQATPLGRAATPGDIAEVVGFLARSASLMTGQVVVVDGGRVM